MTARGRCRCECSVAMMCRLLRNNILLVAVISSVILGIILGLSIRLLQPSYDVITWIRIWGELFLRMLKLVVLPLTMSCIVVGLASMESSASGKLGAITLGYAFLTQMIAIILGIILVTSIRPGSGFDDRPPDTPLMTDTSYTDVLTDLLRNLVPDNIVKSCTHTVYTAVVVGTPSGEPLNTTDGLMNYSEPANIARKLVYREGMNIMGIIIFSLMMAVALSTLGERGNALYMVFVSLNDVIMTIMKAIMWYAPLGVMSLICSALLDVESLKTAMMSVGLLMVTVVTGCLLHQLVILPALVAIICRRNPYTYFLGMFDAYLAGAASTSGAAAMPYLLRSCPQKLGVNKRVCQFVIPVLTSVNKDGSGLFIAVAVVFIAQTYSVPLGVVPILLITVLASVLVLATSVVPSGSIMVVIMLSNVVQLPIDERLGLLMAVEWFNDRIRTGTNIASHGYGCAIVDSIAKRVIPGLADDTDGSDVTTKFDEISVCVVNVPEEPEGDSDVTKPSEQSALLDTLTTVAADKQDHLV